MDRSEPSFVPGWLRGSNGILTPNQSDSHSHQEFQQRSHPQLSSSDCHVDIDSPRYLLSPRRILPNSASFSEGVNFERVSQSRFAAYNHSSSRLEPERGGRGDSGFDRDWERDMTLGSGRGDQTLGDSFLVKHNSSTASRLDLGILKKTLPLGSLNKCLENGSPRSVPRSMTDTGPVSANTASLSSIMNPTAFDRNFPSLVPQDKNVLQSNLGDVSSLNGRPFWQGSSPKVDVTRVVSPGLASSGSGPFPLSAMVCAAEDLRGLSAEVSTNYLSNDGLTIANQLKVSNGTSAATNVGGVPLSHPNVPKMAEALLQNSSRARAVPQQAIDNQRLEELAWKQSRQLIPMKPSLPKTMVQGLSPRDRPKPKVGRVSDVAAAGVPKLNQPKSSSQLSSSLYRPMVATRPETLKYQPGMLVVPKTNKDPLSGVSAGGQDSVTSQISNSSSLNVGAAVGSSSGLNLVIRKPKQALDRRSVAAIVAGSVSDSGGMPARLKDGTVRVDDKRLSSQAQNRSDFFNALRRKAAAATITVNSDSLEVSDTAPLQKGLDEDSIQESPCPSETRKHSCGVETFGCQLDITSDEIIVEGNDINSSILKQLNSKFDSSDLENKCNFANEDTSGGKVDIIKDIAFTSSRSDNISRNTFVVSGSEEEEAEFLKSLGWVENPDDEEEALTEEEISSFLKQHMPAITSRGLCSQYSLRLEKLHVYTENFRFTSSGDCLGDGGCVSQSQELESPGTEMKD